MPRLVPARQKGMMLSETGPQRQTSPKASSSSSGEAKKLTSSFRSAKCTLIAASTTVSSFENAEKLSKLLGERFPGVSGSGDRPRPLSHGAQPLGREVCNPLDGVLDVLHRARGQHHSEI